MEVFHMNEEQATALITSSVFLLKEDLAIVKNMNKLLEPSINSFSEGQAESAFDLLMHISGLDGEPNQFQREVMGSFKEAFRGRFDGSEGWQNKRGGGSK
jgi:hypothetical protein